MDLLNFDEETEVHEGFDESEDCGKYELSCGEDNHGDFKNFRPSGLATSALR
ncbi:hypothetical protein BaRGS_00005034, partial [Batillaria attramentaria]